MSNLVGCREIESLCRQRAISDRAHSWKWLGEADRWNVLGHREIASRSQNNSMHAGPMAMGPNTIEGDFRRQKHKSRQHFQSAMRGGLKLVWRENLGARQPKHCLHVQNRFFDRAGLAA
jgi:hypothetical protein